MTDEWSVVLNRYELAMCERAGRARFANAKAKNCDPGDGPSREALAKGDPSHVIRGCECEYAGSLILNLYWRPYVETMKEASTMGDLGGLVEIRSTVLPHGRLIVKPNAKDDRPYGLVMKRNVDHFRLVGWLFAIEAKELFPLETRFGDPAHFAAQWALRPNKHLRSWIAHAREVAA